MTPVLRRPLTSRQPQSSHKRQRSPDGNESNIVKKIKPTLSQTIEHIPTPTGDTDTRSTAQNSVVRSVKDRNDKLRQKEEREQAHREFLTKYTKAFPSFVFYFDDRDGSRQYAESRVLALGATIEHFFSVSVTHVITNRPQPPKSEQCDLSNKENAAVTHLPNKGSTLRSPIQLKGRAHDHAGYDKLVRDAVQLHKKIWNVSKLENILSRLIPSAAPSSKPKTGLRSTQLNQLLHHEKVHGTTSERDPRERRHDYQYFSKHSHFFLVEDIRGELAPIAIMEYSSPSRSSEKDKLPSYPVLYLDPRARCPFVKYDDKETRRQNKIETTERLKDMEKDKLRMKVKRQLKQREENQRRIRSLRRCVSMGRLGEQVPLRLDLFDPDLDESDGPAMRSNSLGLVQTYHQVASGFGQSTTGQSTGYGHLAASGNSVPITSTTTTSLFRGAGSSLHLPPGLRERLAHQVITNRRLEITNGGEKLYIGEQRLRKAKSTTTMRLPKREENKKPGYCEACRIKFEDFKDHVNGSRHCKFAQNENNYIDLDFLLRRLERQRCVDVFEVEAEVKSEDTSSAFLGPGDYFYVSPKIMDDEWDEGSVDVPP